MKLNTKGFTVIESFLVLLVLSLVVLIGGYAYSRISSQSQVAQDAITSENLEKTRTDLSSFVTKSKTIPKDMETEDAISYKRIDNQTAELCGSFAVPRSNQNDSSFSPADFFKKYFGAASKTHYIYRDDVDFYNHSTGRNCYKINYTPINTAYEDRFKGDDKNWQVCDSYRQYEGKYEGQTIQGFTIGGPITVGASDGKNIVLAQDIDAYDENCVKIPVSDLQAGDKVQLFIETFNHTNTEFVKAIKKTQ